MALTTYNITGSLKDALGGSSLIGEVTFTPYGTHDARVDGADALLGPVRYSIADLPATVALSAGGWQITIRSTGRVNGDQQFKTITRTLDLTGPLTWGDIVAGAVSSPPMTPTLVEEAQLAADEAEMWASTAQGIQDTAVKTLVDDPASATRASLSATYGTGVSVLSKGAVGDGSADDAPAFTQAITSAALFGADVIVPANGAGYRFDSIVTAQSGVTVRGVGGARIFTNLSLAAAFGGGEANISDFTLDGLTIEGSVVEEGVYPRRGRTGGATGFLSAIALTGDAYPFDGPHPVVKNISVVNCRLRNLAGLPVFFRGVRGFTRFVDNHVSNCMDAGFVYCDTVAVGNNVIEKSADNGVSVSRECKRVFVSNNTIRDSAYYGAWVSGYVGETESTFGPDAFVVSGNVVSNSGHGGIALRDAPRWGVCTGNLVDGTTFGPTDEPSSASGTGLSITGWPSTPLGAPTRTAAGINVSGNVFRNCVRNGIGIRGAEDIRFSDNLFIDIGSATDADGVAIPSTSTAANCGIAASEGTSANMSRIVVMGNTFVDSRATAVSNYAITPEVAAASGYVGEGNKVFRYRQAHVEHQTIPNSGYYQAMTAAGAARKLWGLTSSDNMRTVLPGAGKQWEGYNDTESSLLWRITSSGRFDGSVAGVSTKYNTSAPAHTVNGHMETFYDGTRHHIAIGSNGASRLVTASLIAAAVLDFPSVAASGGTQDLTITVPGAALGSPVSLGLQNPPVAGIVYQAWVSAADVVTVRATNCTAGAIDPGSVTFRVKVT